MKRILLYGFGNPGRQDDGLGPAFVETIEKWREAGKHNIPDTDSNYQLNVEDALAISEYDMVIFADASTEEDVDDFRFAPLDPATADVKYTLHAASPAYILHLCHNLYKKYPETWLMRIRGYEWDFDENLTPAAKENLFLATEHFQGWLKEWMSRRTH